MTWSCYSQWLTTIQSQLITLQAPESEIVAGCVVLKLKHSIQYNDEQTKQQIFFNNIKASTTLTGVTAVTTQSSNHIRSQQLDLGFAYWWSNVISLNRTKLLHLF